MSDRSFSWAMPVMRTGYAGRGLVYLVIAGYSLWAIWRGGQAEGTSSALQRLEGTPGGKIVLGLIFLGMLCYMVWRLLDSFYDLEAYGSNGKGLVARTGMVVTGLSHGAIGVLALSILIGATVGGGGGGSGSSGSGGGGGSKINEWTAALMSQPYGPWLVGIVALCIIGAGLYYIKKGWAEDYRKELRASHFTMNWNWALKTGCMAQGVAIAIIGGLFLNAALQHDPSEAGGTGQAFSWLSQQTYGQVLVTLLCLGLLAFAFFCFVNAGYRIVAKVADEDVETLGKRLKAKAEQAAR